MVDIVKILEKASVPSELHEKVLACMKRAEEGSKETRKYKWRAPFVMLPVCYNLPWEAEKLPEKYKVYDNNISINGDQGIWRTRPDGTQYRLPIPIDVKGNSNNDWGNPYNYYAPKKLSARHWFARWVWLGLRNKACGAADEAGFEVPLGAEVKTWSWSGDNEKANVYWVPELDIWQVSHVKKRLGFFHVRENMGYKISNLNSIDRIASVIWIPFSFKIRKRNVE